MSKNIIREMTDLINQMIANRNFQGAVDSLSIYKDSFGIDEIYQHFNERLLKWENSPKIAVICLECSEEEIQEEIINQSFLNIELVLWSKEDGNLIDNLVEYLTMTTAEYICFLESKHKIHPSKIESMFKYIKHTQDVDAVICKRFFINAQQIIIKHQNFECDKILDHKPIPGDILLESCFKDGINIYNNLTCLLIKTEKLKKIKFKKFDTSFVELEKTYVLYQILISSYVQLMDNTLVTRFSIKEDKNKYQLLKRDFCKLVETMGMELPIKIEKDYSGIEKKITCFYTDKGEYYNLKPIGDEAKKRGYEVKYTENINEKAEIGIYCQHQCFPKNSKFSMVLLHDMAQAHNRWPNIWQAENWHEFDIGILPGKMWADYWEESGGIYLRIPY